MAERMSDADFQRKYQDCIDKARAAFPDDEIIWDCAVIEGYFGLGVKYKTKAGEVMRTAVFISDLQELLTRRWGKACSRDNFLQVLKSQVANGRKRRGSWTSA